MTQTKLDTPTEKPPFKIGYFDCFSGASGDMLLGALLHSGFDKKHLNQQIGKLGLEDITIVSKKSTRAGIEFTKVSITSTSQQQLRTLPIITQLFQESSLDKDIVEMSSKVFIKLAEAEAKVHGTPVEKVHFHEVGAIDTIVDVVGVVSGLKYLGVDKLVSSPLPIGRGFVHCDHGMLPLPAPAVCELLHSIPTYGTEHSLELVTPTGAAILATLCQEFGTFPPMKITATGYGGGVNSFTNNQPNLLRFITGFATDVYEEQLVDVIETNLDDWNSELFPHLCELLFDQGALDVTLTPTLMKKGRPGYILQIISPLFASHEIKEIILHETTAIGLRFSRIERQTLPRKKVYITTPWGEVAAKEVHTPQKIVIYPEYDACKQIAIEHNIALQEVYNIVRTYKKGKQ